MLALQSYEQSNGFSVLTSDELYYVNGGSSTFSTGGYYQNICNWRAEVHYESEKRTVDAYIECKDGKISANYTHTKK